MYDRIHVLSVSPTYQSKLLWFQTNNKKAEHVTQGALSTWILNTKSYTSDASGHHMNTQLQRANKYILFSNLYVLLDIPHHDFLKVFGTCAGVSKQIVVEHNKNGQNKRSKSGR